MFITNSRSAGQACSTCPECPNYCEPRLSGQFNILGLVFILLFFIFYLVGKKKKLLVFFHRRRYRKILIIIGLFFLFSGIMYLVQFSYNNTAGQCYFDGLLLKFKFWPASFSPFLKNGLNFGDI